jgi:drug/metabolite transporter (DMT)-like permease
MTPRFTYKTKKWVSIFIIAFGVIMLLQGIFSDQIQRGIEQIPTKQQLENIK